ncbi:PREDICTED: sialin-like [Nicrophorus vespilloides]|uniref:Sialin-like n=1 Tax=Nicrophorus vespilloides TaxID=110193 RepID=A0ABM1NDP6_NICVS|nr:PREDICTED: sialin-like [Nicrophorus vespilloides]
MVVQTKSFENATCKLEKGQESVLENIGGGKIDWDEHIQSYVLLSFYIGYTITQLLAGVICDKVGAKYPVVVSIGLSTITTMLIPVTVMSKFHWLYPFTLRFLCGLGQGFAFPAVTTFLARWVPSDERGVLGSIVYSGYSFGIVFGTLISGLSIDYFSHWAAPYYIWSFAGVVWLPFFVLWATSEPVDHKYITPEEMALIESNIESKQKSVIPLRKILSDIGVWGLIIGQTGNNYITLNLITYLPKYLNNVLNYNMQQNAWASSLPFIGMFLSGIMCGRISDYLTKKKNVNVNLMRKVCTFLGTCGPAFFLLLSGYANCNRLNAMIFICISIFFKGPFYAGLKINGMDLTTHYAGTLMSFSNGFGSMPGFIGPYVIGKLAPNNALHEWQLVYWITLAVTIVCTIFYLLTGKARRAKWDYTDEEWNQLDHTKKKRKWYLQYSPEEIQQRQTDREERRLRSLSRSKKIPK